MGALPGSPADGARTDASAALDLEPAAAQHREVQQRRSRRSERARRSRAGGLLANFGIGVSVAMIVAAPLAAGSVHRAMMIALMMPEISMSGLPLLVSVVGDIRLPVRTETTLPHV